jgi:hypothetical protein
LVFRALDITSEDEPKTNLENVSFALCPQWLKIFILVALEKLGFVD